MVDGSIDAPRDEGRVRLEPIPTESPLSNDHPSRLCISGCLLRHSRIQTQTNTSTLHQEPVVVMAKPAARGRGRGGRGGSSSRGGPRGGSSRATRDRYAIDEGGRPASAVDDKPEGFAHEHGR